MRRYRLDIRPWVIVAAALLGAVLLVRGMQAKAARQQLSSNDERVKYLAALGWEVEAAAISEQTVRLPKEFPPVLEDYNRLQLQQGFDLKACAGKEVTVYTYRVLNYDSAEEVYCCLYLRKNRVVGGDVHSASLSGFMTGIISTENG